MMILCLGFNFAHVRLLEEFAALQLLLQIVNLFQMRF